MIDDDSTIPDPELELTRKDKSKFKRLVREIVKNEAVLKKKIIILELFDSGFDHLTGYMDDGSEAYKRFAVNQWGEIFIEGTYPKKIYGGRINLANIIRKFDPDLFFLSEPIEVDRLDYNELKDLYTKHYELPYHGGFKIIKENAQKVEIVWDGSGKKEILSQEECKDLKLPPKKGSKNHSIK